MRQFTNVLIVCCSAVYVIKNVVFRLLLAIVRPVVDAETVTELKDNTIVNTFLRINK